MISRDENAHNFLKLPLFTVNKGNFIAKNDSFIAIWDAHPVTPLHALLIPQAERKTFFDLDEAEVLAFYDLLGRVKATITEKDKSVDGFNIGMNCEGSAGQTVMQCHVHVIPRRKGDMADPRGGVRAVFADKKLYG